MTNNPLRIYGLAGDTNGCGEYRIYSPMKALLERGHQVGAGTNITPQILDAVDIVVGQRLCLPEITLLWEGLRKIGNHLLVYELDDDLFTLDPSNKKAYKYYSKANTRENIIRCLRASHLVTVSTEALRVRVQRYNKNVAVIPNYLPEQIFTIRPVDQRVETPVIGWAGGLNHQMDFEWTGNGINNFFVDNPQHPLRFIGGPYANFVPDAKNVSHDRGNNRLHEYHKLLDFQIGLAVVKPHPFNASKSYLKALEYGARGIVTVASDYTTYNGFITDGVDGFLVQPREIADTLDRLVRDEPLRLAVQNAAYRRAQENTIEDNVWRYEEAYRAAL